MASHYPKHPQQPPAVYDDEIDLFEIFEALWKGKYIILLCAAVGLVLSVGYALLAQQQWTSKTYIKPPQAQQINHYLDRYLQFNDVSGSKSKSVQEISEDVFKQFLTQASSVNNKLSFISKTGFYEDNVE